MCLISCSVGREGLSQLRYRKGISPMRIFLQFFGNIILVKVNLSRVINKKSRLNSKSWLEND